MIIVTLFYCCKF